MNLPVLGLIIGAFLCAGIGLAGVIGLIEYWRTWWTFKAAIKRNSSDRWNELSKVLGYAGRDPAGWIEYIYNERDVDDPEIEALKRRLRLLFPLYYVCFVSASVGLFFALVCILALVDQAGM